MYLTLSSSLNVSTESATHIINTTKFNINENYITNIDKEFTDNTEIEEVTTEVEEITTEIEEVTTVNNKTTDNCCYITIDSIGLHSKFYIGDHSQSSVDTYDIVFTKDIYDYNGTIRFLGHNNRSLSLLHKVSVGDIICISDKSGVDYKYEVLKSEMGYLSEDNFDIFSSSTNECLTNKGYVEFVTCHGSNKNNRWVVLCEQIIQ